MSFELIGSGIMSSVMPNDSTCSRKRERLSTDHLSSRLDGRQAAADVIDAEAGHRAEDLIDIAVLCADLHQGRPRRTGGLRGLSSTRALEAETLPGRRRAMAQRESPVDSSGDPRQRLNARSVEF